MNPKKLCVLPKNKKYNIVFVGNSFTYYNDLPDMFRGIAEKMGYDVAVKPFTFANAQLFQFAATDNEYGAGLDKVLNNEKVDFTVFQEQSTNPAVDTATFFRGFRMCCEKAKKNGAAPVMYVTWGREDGHADLTRYGMTHEEMMWRIAAAYQVMAKEWDAICAEVGIAFNYLYRNHPEIRPFVPDACNHPTPEGSYMGALTIFATIFGVDVRQVPDNEAFSAETNEILRSCAYNAAFFEHPIPDEFVIADAN